MAINDTFATESFGNLLAAADNSTFPGACSLEIAGQRHADERADPAGLQCVALHDHHRTSKNRCGTNWLAVISPPNFALSDYHSDFFKTCCVKHARSRVIAKFTLELEVPRQLKVVAKLGAAPSLPLNRLLHL
jgi:hypothetical protein